MTGEIWEKGYVRVEGGKITELGPMKNGAPFPLPEGEQVMVVNAFNSSTWKAESSLVYRAS